ncbi:PP2C family protein-serine/threonine phosphatase [Streptomyces hygroscopicus]|uniref:PP2C family protein-serine/threonine phosphatase n=1 Tax=Streptomyces hygroscopicus TaxID=1912 RepID=UPI000767A347|nr:PP2C family protein-serine/threonine phosphatase [Streptomyces hygroscopicus]
MAGVIDCSRMLRGILADSHMTCIEQLPAYVSRHARTVGLRDVFIYVSDLQQDVLFRLTGRGPDAGGTDGSGRSCELRIEGTAAGSAYQLGLVQPDPPGPDPPVPQAGVPAHRWWVPLRHGAERLGVLGVTSQDGDEQTLADLQALADLIGLLVVSKRALSDSYARLVRTQPMNVAAEMQWHLMPPLTFASDQVVLSAVLEPAYQVSGDAFDYAVADRVVHLGIFDAMGHDTPAGVTANLAVAACRNSRRQGADLVATADHIEDVLTEQFGGTRYTTAVLADLDTRTGMLSWVNRGHPPPVLFHPDHRNAHLVCDPGPPLGTDLGQETLLCRAQLHPGDQIVAYTDGITEARNPTGREFGLDRFIDFITTHLTDGMSIPETLRRLVHSILDYHHGHLTDDATILLLHWHGPTPFDPGEAEALVGLSQPAPTAARR